MKYWILEILSTEQYVIASLFSIQIVDRIKLDYLREHCQVIEENHLLERPDTHDTEESLS